MAALAAAACTRTHIVEVGDDEPSRLRTRWSAPTHTTTPGTYALGLERFRDGFLYVPTSYRATSAAPLAIVLHGSGQSSSEWSNGPLDQMFGSRGYVVLGPDSRDYTWDILAGGFGPDVQFMDSALALTFSKCNIDSRRILLCGFSDGGSYALSLGLSNGDVFAGVMGLSPGFVQPGPIHGKPPIFMAHGAADTILPIDATSRTIVPQLRREGYDVTYTEFNGPHAIVVSIVEQGADWFLARTAH